MARVAVADGVRVLGVVVRVDQLPPNALDLVVELLQLALLIHLQSVPLNFFFVTDAADAKLERLFLARLIGQGQEPTLEGST